MLFGLAYFSWRFALNLEPFRASLTSRRLQREVNEGLQRENDLLVQRQAELAALNTKNEQTTKELRLVNQNLDEFVYAASHDLKAPLRAIDNLSQFIMDDAKDDLSQQATQDLAELQGRVLRMERLLDGLLEYSRSQNSEFAPEEMDVAEVVQDAVGVLDVPKNFNVDVAIADIRIHSQRPPFEQVVRKFQRGVSDQFRRACLNFTEQLFD